MALVLANRVQESGTANTTVSFTLTGAVTGFQSFSTIGNGNTTYYSATDASGNWEVGLGTYSTTGPTLTRTTIYASSNSGSAVTFSGAVNVFVTYPSGKSVNLDDSGNVSALGTVTSGTWQGSTVGVAYGGTGVTASSGPNSVVLRDANENITINRLNQGLQTVTASGGVTALTAASDFNQALVGTGGHTYSLPDATTLSDTTAFQFNNNATGTLTITDYASATVGTIAPGGAAGVALLNNSTVGGTWDVHAYIPENVTWGTNALALGTTVITGGTWNGGTIQSGYGGTGLTTFAGANNALYSTSASALAAGTLPVAAGGTGLTSYTLNGVVYASGTGTLATGSALTFDGTNLINTGAYTAPSNGAGAGTKTTIRGSTGTGQAGTSGGNGFIELVGGGGTSTWTAFAVPLTARRRGGINLQAGTAQADAGGTYVSGSNIDILGSAGTNNGTSVGVGSRIVIQSGSVTKTDGQLNFGSSIVLGSSTSTSGSPVSISSGSFSTASGSNNASSVTFAAGTATNGGDITLAPGNATVSGSTVGKAYIRDPATSTNYEILTTNNVTSASFVNGTADGVAYLNSSKVLTTGSLLTFDGTNLGLTGTNPAFVGYSYSTAFYIDNRAPNKPIVVRVSASSAADTEAITIAPALVTVTPTTILANAFRFYTGGSDGSTAYGDFRTNPATGNSIISAKTNALYFNYDHGTGGVIFCNGASGIVGYIDGSGNASFNGTLSVGSTASATTAAEKTATTVLATTAFADRLRSLTTPSTGTSGTLDVGDRGALVQATGGITVPASVFAAQDVVTVANNSASSITLTQGAGLTMYLVGTATTGNRTIAQRGLATIVFLSATVAIVSGGGVT